MNMIPVHEVVAHFRAHGITETVLERIARLNPEGVREGMIPRGFHRKRTVRTTLNMVVMSRQAFVARYGVDSFRRLPACAFVSMGGKRRAVSLFAITAEGKSRQF